MVRKDRASQEDPDGDRAAACMATYRSRSEARGRDPREYRARIGFDPAAWREVRGPRKWAASQPGHLSGVR
jgi:hypothetical protein